MYKNLFLFFIVLLVGCSSNPISLYTENVNILPLNKHHLPEINGVLHVQVKGFRYSYIFIPKEPTTKPAQVTTKPYKSMAPIETEPVFDFFKDKTDLKGATKKLFKIPSSVSGSCFVVAKINSYYYSVTARHVVLIPEPKVYIDGQKGEIIKIFSAIDIAIIRFKSNKKYPIYKFNEAKLMEDAWIVGFPASIDGKKRKFAVKGQICNVSKHETWFSGGGAPGMSGGTILNKKNEVLGVVTRFLTTDRHCDNFIHSVPPHLFKSRLKVILLKEQIKELAKKINFLESLKM